MLSLHAVRPATDADAPEMAALLNEIIEIGGTTAFEDPVDAEDMVAWYMTAPGAFCHAAIDSAGKVAGFQAIEQDPNGAPQIGYISTFARQTPRVKGVGTALFAATTTEARARGLSAIDAKIRADNVPGLAYYSSIGFEDRDILRDVPLKDGTPVDRIIKRFDLR